jgi:hypothetical protein
MTPAPDFEIDETHETIDVVLSIKQALRPLKRLLFDSPRDVYACLRQSVSRRRNRPRFGLELALNPCAQELCNGTSARKPGIKT